MSDVGGRDDRRLFGSWRGMDDGQRQLSHRQSSALSNRSATSFGLLILAQAAHSIEEYTGRLWASFPPARLVSGLVSDDLRLGFLAVNVALLSFGVWCYLWPVSRGWRSARAIALGWAVVELVNGVGHPLWSVRRGGYTPGAVTAPVLLILAAALAWQLRPASRRHMEGE